MSSKILLLAIVALVGAGIYMNQLQQTTTLESSFEQILFKRFIEWRVAHKKTYENEHLAGYRFRVWIENVMEIESENAKGLEYQLGENEFTDLTKEEWSSIYLMKIEQPEPIEETDSHLDENVEILEAVNWQSAGAVTPVKNQGSCGSCWSFSTTGVVEGYWKINKGSLPNLSEQQLVDCSTANYGCDGGWPYKALDYVRQHPLTTESAYPYTGKQGTCKAAASKGTYGIKAVQRTSGCNSLTADINKQPTSVCVDASNWQSYKSGVFSNCGTSTNHAVLATGYDSSNNWIIKNSWGTSWGQKGYITLKNGNTCGVCSQLANAQ